MKLKGVVRDLDRQFRKELIPFARAARDDLLLRLRQSDTPEGRIAIVDSWEQQWAAQAQNVRPVQIQRSLRVVRAQAANALRKVQLDPPEVPLPRLGHTDTLRSQRQRFVADLATRSRDAAAVGAPRSVYKGTAQEILRRSDRAVRLTAFRTAHVAATLTTKRMLEDLGVTRFVWRAQRDGKVRAEHRALDGEVFSTASGAPGVGLPGMPMNCRCVMEPYRKDRK